MSHRHIGLFPATFELREAQLFNHKLHPGFRAIFSIAQGIEYPDHGFYTRDKFVHRGEFTKNLRYPWR